jgi:hypothetical protein
MTTQTLIELVDSALSMQTQYSLRPSLYRIEAAKKAKTALLDALEAQAAELGYLRQALEHAINSTFTRKLDACQADCKILERERDELRAERAEFKSKLAVEAKAADHWMKEACKSHNLAVKLEAELAALKAQPVNQMLLEKVKELADWHGKTRNLWPIGMEQSTFHNGAALTLSAIAQAQASEPATSMAALSQQAVVDAFCEVPDSFNAFGVFKQGVRFAEQHHGITQGEKA